MKSDFNFLGGAIVTTPLSELAPGTHAVVREVRGGGPIGRRLLDLGLLPGTPVTVVRRAPLGDPVVYELRGYRLCLRRADSALVLVTPDVDAPERAAG